VQNKNIIEQCMYKPNITAKRKKTAVLWHLVLKNADMQKWCKQKYAAFTIPEQKPWKKDI